MKVCSESTGHRSESKDVSLLISVEVVYARIKDGCVGLQQVIPLVALSKTISHQATLGVDTKED